MLSLCFFQLMEESTQRTFSQDTDSEDDVLSLMLSLCFFQLMEESTQRTFSQDTDSEDDLLSLMLSLCFSADGGVNTAHIQPGHRQRG